MLKQSTNTIIMVSPDHFGFNGETSGTNPYQHTLDSLHKNASQVRRSAQKEFANMVKQLTNKGIRVLVLPSSKNDITPDAVFPNNWFSHFQGGTLAYFPMLALNR